MQIGIPAGFSGILFSLSNVVIQSAINGFGNIVVAGNSAASNIENFVYVSMNTFYQACISFTSQNVGARRYDRVNKILLASVGCAVVSGLVLGNLAYVFGPALLGLYTTSSIVIQKGLTRLSIISTTYALCGVMDTMVGSMRGLGYSVLPMIVSLVGACGLRLLWIATIFQIPQFHTPQVIYYSYPLTWTITALIHIICYLVIWKKLKKRLAVEEARRKRETV